MKAVIFISNETAMSTLCALADIHGEEAVEIVSGGKKGIVAVIRYDFDTEDLVVLSRLVDSILSIEFN